MGLGLELVGVGSLTRQPIHTFIASAQYEAALNVSSQPSQPQLQRTQTQVSRKEAVEVSNQ